MVIDYSEILKHCSRQLQAQNKNVYYGSNEKTKEKKDTAGKNKKTKTDE